MPFGDGRKLQKMKKAERGVGLAVVNRDLVFFFSLIAIGDGRKKKSLWRWKKITKDEKS